MEADVTADVDSLRWDYEDAIQVARDTDIAPRLALAFDPSGRGRTSIRAGYGVYYDAVLFQALVNTSRGSQVARLQVVDPGYPDPFGLNPNRGGAAVNALPNGRRFADRIRTPYTGQTSAGVSHVRSSFSMTLDVVWASGRNLIRTRDANKRPPSGHHAQLGPGEGALAAGRPAVQDLWSRCASD